MNQFNFTLVHAQIPDRLSKGFRAGPKGELIKKTGGQLVKGVAHRRTATIETLAEIIRNLTPSEALIWGVAPHPTATVVTQAALTQGNGRPTIARTQEFFSYPEENAIMMVDYDPSPDGRMLSGTEFRDALIDVSPKLRDAPALLMPSASSFIYRDSEELIGPKGWRMLIVVDEGADIPRAGRALYGRTWLAGHGYVAVSNAGSLLTRSLIDSTVWGPERLDFCAGAACERPIVQRRPPPIVFNPDAPPMKPRDIKDLSHQDTAIYNTAIEQARKAAEPKARVAREMWIERETERLTQPLPEAERAERQTQIRETLRRACNYHTLTPDFILTTETGKSVTVGEILENPGTYHGKRFRDPLEPSYRNDPRIAFANLRSTGKPFIFSHAHGGQRYELLNRLHTLEVTPGTRYETTRQAMDILNSSGSFFVRGNEIVSVTPSGRVIPQTEKTIALHLDEKMKWTKFDGRTGKPKAVDAPISIATAIVAAQGTWPFVDLLGTAYNPVIEPTTGRIIAEEGYDPASKLMLSFDSEAWHAIPDKPSAREVSEALKTIWEPFSLFPFADPLSRGVFVSAVLTAPIRQVLPTAPAIGIDSASPGTGKTLLTKCIALLSGDAPAVVPFTGDEDEVRKRLLALLRQNTRTIILDNADTPIESSALCAMLTSDKYSDRVLGLSEAVSLPTRTNILISGNNLTLRGDLCRRVLMSRLDAKMEKPWKRKFHTDPLAHIALHRMKIVRGCLLLLRAGMTSGDELPDRMASFETWSDTVRKTVTWIGKTGRMDVTDPGASIDRTFEIDANTRQLHALLNSWHAEFGDERKTVKEAIRDATFVALETMREDGTSEINTPLLEIFLDIAGDSGGNAVNTRRLGRWLERNREKIVNGKYLERGESKARSILWRVRKK